MQITEISLHLLLSTQTEGNLVRIHQFISSKFALVICYDIFIVICVTDALLIINLPAGPTAHFKLSKLILRKDIKVLYLYFLYHTSKMPLLWVKCTCLFEYMLFT
jgi:hypothetical protein